MRKRGRGSKKRALNDRGFKQMSSMEIRGHNTHFSDRDERIYKFWEGVCKVGVCGTDAACRQFNNNTFTCLCPHDSQPPTKDYRCPTRNTVPLDPRPIENILPPQLNDTKSKTGAGNRTTAIPIHLSTSSITEKEVPSQEFLIAGSVVAVAILFVAACFIWRRTRSFEGRHKSSASPSPIVLKRSLLVADRYTPNPQYSACTSASTTVPILRQETLQFLCEIGEGCFGKVYKGEILGENDQAETVAIKVLKETASREAEEDFLREVDIMSAFKHINILSLLGVVFREANVNPMMVFEYMPHGDLAEVLRNQKSRHPPEGTQVPILDCKDLHSIALQVANGMKYLAAQRFVHRDLACRNCLVAQGPVVKIADFGMSRDVYTCDYYKIGGSRLLPVRWMSPESVMYGRFTLESDIWSYGIVLWEIYSFGKQPYYGHTNEEVVKLILQGIMLIPPDDCPTLICELMQSCWKTEPRDRIRFTDIYDKLEKCFINFEDRPIKYKMENESRMNSLKKLPRPPPLNLTPKLDLLDADGYLLPKEIKEPVQYLETLPD